MCGDLERGGGAGIINVLAHVLIIAHFTTMEKELKEFKRNFP